MTFPFGNLLPPAPAMEPRHWHDSAVMDVLAQAQRRQIRAHIDAGGDALTYNSTMDFVTLGALLRGDGDAYRRYAAKQGEDA